MLPADHIADIEVLWDYNQMRHEPRRCDVAIVLGSHDIGVAGVAAGLYREGLFPVAVFSGGTPPATAGLFPRGEAVHFREHAVSLGLPQDVTLMETEARNTGENIAFSRRALTEAGLEPASVLLVTKPYMERRAFATCRKTWPQADPVCASARVPLTRYLDHCFDPVHTVHMIVGDTRRVIEYPARGFAVPQHVPDQVHAALGRLVSAGYTRHLPGLFTR